MLLVHYKNSRADDDITLQNTISTPIIPKHNPGEGDEGGGMYRNPLISCYSKATTRPGKGMTPTTRLGRQLNCYCRYYTVERARPQHVSRQQKQKPTVG